MAVEDSQQLQDELDEWRQKGVEFEEKRRELTRVKQKLEDQGYLLQRVEVGAREKKEEEECTCVFVFVCVSLSLSPQRCRIAKRHRGAREVVVAAHGVTRPAAL